MAAAAAQGTVFHHHARPSSKRIGTFGGGRRAARHQQTDVSDLAVVVSGRQSDLELHRFEAARHRRRRADGGPGTRGGGPGVADRLRQRVEPAGRARDQPAARTRGARGPGRVARARRAISDGGKRGARDWRRVARRAAGADRRAPAPRCWRRLLPAHPRDCAGWTGLLAPRRSDRGERAAVRRGAGGVRHRRPGRRVTAVDGAFLDRQCQREAAAADSGRQPVCHCHAAAGRGGPAAREPEAAGARRSRIRYAQRPQRIDFAAGDAVRHCGPRHRVLGSAAAAPRGAAGCLAHRVRGQPAAERRRQLQQLRSGRLSDGSGAVAAGDAVGVGQPRLLPAARSVAARRPAAGGPRRCRRESRVGRRGSRMGPAVLSQVRAPSANGFTKAAARPVPGRPWLASSAR